MPSASSKIRRLAHIVGVVVPVLCVAQQPKRQVKKPPTLPASGVSHVVITGEEIRRQNAWRLDDILRGEVPDVFATSSATSMSTMLRSRGFSSTTTVSTPRVYLNGVELDNPSSLREIDPDIVDSVVVRPGAVAGAYDGIGADGGVIYVYTQRGNDSTQVSPVLKAIGGKDRSLYGQGSQRFSSYLTSVSGGREGATYYLAWGNSSEGAWAPGYTSRVNHWIGSLTSKGRYGTVSAFWRRQRDAGSPDDRSLGFGSTALDTGFRRDTAEHTTYGGMADLTLTPYWTIHASGGLHRAEYGDAGRNVILPDTISQNGHETIKRTSYDARTTVRIPLAQSVTTSVTIGANQAITSDAARSAFSLGTINTSRTESRLDQIRRGYFGLTSLRFGNFFVVNAGARKDTKLGPVTSEGTKWRPRGDAAFMMPTPYGTLTVRGGVSSMVVPTITTIPVVGLPTNQFYSVQDLHAAEAGADLAGQFGAIGATAYDQHADDRIVQFSTQFGLPATFNVGSVRNRGLSAYARGEYQQWSVRAMYSVVQARVDTVLQGPAYLNPNALPNAMGHGTVAYKSDKLRLSYDVQYTASHHDLDVIAPVPGGRTYPAFFLHDVNMSVPWGEDARFIIYGHNIANAEEYDVNNGMYVRGRRIGFGVRLGEP